MPEILLVTARPERLAAFADSLEAAEEVKLSRVRDAAGALDRVRSAPPQLAVIDSALPDTTPLELVKQMLQANAMINTAVVSALDEDAFHEASEGLGVMTRLPDPPGPEDASAVLVQLDRILHPG